MPHKQKVKFKTCCLTRSIMILSIILFLSSIASTAIGASSPQQEQGNPRVIATAEGGSSAAPNNHHHPPPPPPQDEAGHQQEESQAQAAALAAAQYIVNQEDEGEEGKVLMEEQSKDLFPSTNKWGKLLNKAARKAKEVVDSQDFQQMSYNAYNLFKEIKEGGTNLETVNHMRQKVDQAISRTVNSMENMLRVYDMRSPELAKLLDMSKARVTSMIEAGMKRLMTEESRHGCLVAVNRTALLVEEEAARLLPHPWPIIPKEGEGEEEAAKAAAAAARLATLQKEVMRKMIIVAEDAEAVGAYLVHHPYVRKRTAPTDLRQYEGMLNSRLVPRLILTVTAAVVHGWRPLDDPFFAMLVLAYASGSLTRQLAGNILTIFEKTLLGQNVVKDHFLMESLPDIWRTSDTTEEIGQGLFRLFETLDKRSGNGRSSSSSKKALLTAAATAAAPLFRSTRKGAYLYFLVHLVHFLRVYGKALVTGIIAAIVLLMIIHLVGY